MIQHVAELDIASASSDELDLLLRGMEDALQRYQSRFPLGLADIPNTVTVIRAELARREQVVQHA